MNGLDYMRKQIDKIDEQLLRTLEKRYKVVAEIGILKKSLGLQPLDKKRWEKVIESKIKLGKKLGLPKDLITTIYEAIHKYSLEIEK